MLEDIHKRKSSSKYPNEYRYNEELDCYEIIFNTPKTNGKVCLIDNEDYDFCQNFIGSFLVLDMFIQQSFQSLISCIEK